MHNILFSDIVRLNKNQDMASLATFSLTRVNRAYSRVDLSPM